MQFPASFQAQRSALESLCNQVSLISLHSYETASAVSSAAGAVLLADAVQDTSRRFRPEAWNAVILYAMGSGPVRGFAITLALGIITSVFTALYITRVLIVLWFERRRPKKIEV